MHGLHGNYGRWALLLLSLSVLGYAGASHFRGGWIKYSVDADSLTATFKVTTAWRSTSTGPSIRFRYGDGNSLWVYPFDTAGVRGVPIADVGSGADWRMTEATLTYPYSNGLAGTFLEVGFQTCCRIPIENAGSESRVDFLVYTGFYLAAGATSPALSVPPILQMPVNKASSVDIIAAAASGPNPSCEIVPFSESGIPEVPSVGSNVATVSPSPCQLLWDTTGASVDDLYALQVKYQVPGELPYSTMDFMIQIVDEAPVCQFADAGSDGQYVTSVGGTVAFDLEVDDATYPSVVMSTLPSDLHPGMVYSPGSAVPTIVPAVYSFSYTVPATDAGLTYAFNTIFENSAGVRCTLSMSISVRLQPPPPPLPPPSRCGPAPSRP